jgi:hypothetical protein
MGNWGRGKANIRYKRYEVLYPVDLGVWWEAGKFGPYLNHFVGNPVGVSFSLLCLVIGKERKPTMFEIPFPTIKGTSTFVPFPS